MTSQLSAVAVTSAANAWAVGLTVRPGHLQSLIEHWNGSAWTVMASPAQGMLTGVAATSASNAWAVGTTGSGKALILRWNGKAWKQVPCPAPAHSGLNGVAATSADHEFPRTYDR